MFKNSEEIRVYPTSKRSDLIGNNRQDRLNTEKNFTDIVNRLTGQKSFIIDGLEVTGGAQITSGACNIGGYYITITTNTTITDVTGSGSILYLKIFKSTTSNFIEINGMDDTNGKYTGVSFERGNGITLDGEKLPIAELVGGVWKSIDTSKLAFNLNQLQINTGVLGNTKEQSLANFLENDFVIDAGEL